MTAKRWQYAYDSQIPKAEADALCTELGILPATASILWNRGYHTPNEARNFIEIKHERFHDPFEMKDMAKAVERVFRAVECGEKIMIYGDYDVDGVTSTATLYLFLRELGANVGYHIPIREGEGYGINTGAIDAIISEGYTLMISVDTGITACDEIEYANSHGLETVITDHHQCHEKIPNAIAVVNPKRPDCSYPFKELAGVGVVFKYICAMRAEDNRRRGRDEDAVSYIRKNYADLVAIGTIADVMPLVDENRLIVAVGLEKLEKKARIGLEALLSKTGINSPDKKRSITASVVGYTIAPRLNAAGRLREASIACELLLCDDEKRATEIAESLCEINNERKDTENEIAKETLEMLSDEFNPENTPIIVLGKENWHQGVIGIVASRLTDRYGVPAILVSFDENGMGKGSGRSVNGLNLVHMLGNCSELLEKYGGHELAAGLSVKRENFEAFKAKITEYVKENIQNRDDGVMYSVDGIFTSSDITLRQAEELNLLEPCGSANPSPVFVMQDVKIAEIIGIGQNKHCRINICSNSQSFSCVFFGVGPDNISVKKGDDADIVFSLEINDFRGVKIPQINIKAILPTRRETLEIERQRELYQHIKNNEKYKASDGIFPVRGDFVPLYKYLDRKWKTKKSFCAKELISLCNIISPNAYVKLELMLDVFEEMGLMEVNRTYGDFDNEYTVTPKYVRKKVNFDKSVILKNLRNAQIKD